jgi:hypothetical protein
MLKDNEGGCEGVEGSSAGEEADRRRRQSVAGDNAGFHCERRLHFRRTERATQESVDLLQCNCEHEQREHSSALGCRQFELIRAGRAKPHHILPESG